MSGRTLPLVPLLLLWTTAALANGCFMPSAPSSLNAERTKPSSSAQKAIMIRRGGEETLLLQTTYQGPSGEFAWVIPVPARPTEIFAAEPAFIEQTFLQTEPAVQTILQESKASRWYKGVTTASAPMGPGPAMGGPNPGSPSPVEVLAERNVGDYHAVVLAAVGGQALQKWLTDNKYQLPADAAAVLDGYVQKGWFFVALKMQEQRAQEQPVLTDVAPLGLTFSYPAGKLVFPLTISRLSAPPQSSLLLCTIGDGPYTCETIPSARLEKPLKLSRNETYGDLRRRLTRNPTRLLCEYSGGAPFHYTDLSFRAEDWAQGREGGFHTRRASRFFGLLTPAEMVDLVFVAEPERDPGATPAPAYQVLVQRHGKPLEQRYIQSVRFAAPGSYEQQNTLKYGKLEAPTPSRTRAATAFSLVAAMGLIPLLIVVVVVLIERRRPGGPRGPLVALLVALLLLGAAAEVRCGLPGLSGRAGLPLLASVQQAAEAFLADTGCFPLKADDLAAREAPQTGLDASGNQVPLHGWRGPYLSSLLPPVIEGGRVVCDPLNLYLADSTGFKTVCEPATPEHAANVTGRNHHELKAYWNASPARARAALQPYVEWLAKRRGHKLIGLTHNNSNTPSRDTVIVVADRNDLSYFPLPGIPGTVGAGGLVAGYWEARRVDQQELCFVSLSGPGQPFRLANPKPLSFWKILAVAPDGTLAVHGDNESFLISPQGKRVDLEDLRFGPSGACFSADGKRVYLWSGDIVTAPVTGGKVTTLVSGIRHEGIVGNTHGILFNDHEQHLKWLKPDGTVVQLAADVGPEVKAMTLSAQYAFWATGESRDAEENTIYRVALKDRVTKPVTHYKSSYDQHLTLAAEGAELYIGYVADGTFKKVCLLTAAGKLITLGEKGQLPSPADLPTVE